MGDSTTYTEREAVIPLSPHVPVWVLVDGGDRTHYVGPHPAVALRCIVREGREGAIPEAPDVEGMCHLVPAANMPGGGGWCAMRDLAFTEKMAKAEVVNRNARKQAGKTL